MEDWSTEAVSRVVRASQKVDQKLYIPETEETASFLCWRKNDEKSSFQHLSPLRLTLTVSKIAFNPTCRPQRNFFQTLLFTGTLNFKMQSKLYQVTWNLVRKTLFPWNILTNWGSHAYFGIFLDLSLSGVLKLVGMLVCDSFRFLNSCRSTYFEAVNFFSPRSSSKEGSIYNRKLNWAQHVGEEFTEPKNFGY